METKTESSSAATLPTVAYVSNPLFYLYRPLRLFLVLFCCSVTAHLIVQNVAATTLNTELARLQQNLAKSMFEHVAWRQQMAMEARRVGSRPDLLALLASGCRDGEQKWQALLVEQQRAIVEVAKAQAYGNGIRDAIIATHGLTGPNMGFSHMYQPSNSRLPSIVAASKNATVLGRNLPPPPCSPHLLLTQEISPMQIEEIKSEVAPADVAANAPHSSSAASGDAAAAAVPVSAIPIQSARSDSNVDPNEPSVLSGERSSPRGQPSNPLGQPSNPLGQRSNPLGQRSNPLGQRSNPLGQRSNPLGQRSNPLGHPALRNALAMKCAKKSARNHPHATTAAAAERTKPVVRKRRLLEKPPIEPSAAKKACMSHSNPMDVVTDTVSIPPPSPLSMLASAALGSLPAPTLSPKPPSAAAAPESQNQQPNTDDGDRKLDVLDHWWSRKTTGISGSNLSRFAAAIVRQSSRNHVDVQATIEAWTALAKSAEQPIRSAEQPKLSCRWCGSTVALTWHFMTLDDNGARSRSRRTIPIALCDLHADQIADQLQSEFVSGRATRNGANNNTKTSKPPTVASISELYSTSEEDKPVGGPAALAASVRHLAAHLKKITKS